MATYAIGDIQGCFSELEQLLNTINYNPKADTLWFAGDLVNRGPQSLEVLRLVRSLPNTIVVLGNHDWHLLTLTLAQQPPDETFSHFMQDVLDAPDREQLLQWLRCQKMAHYDQQFDCFLSHAGLPPNWTIPQALRLAAEVEQILQGDQLGVFLDNLYGDQPDLWQDDLTGWDRARYIVNALCRMRYVTEDGRLILEVKGKPHEQPPGYIPWYELKPLPCTVLFGHWASLEGKTSVPKAVALDTGCVWGGSLSALRLDDQRWFAVSKQSDSPL